MDPTNKYELCRLCLQNSQSLVDIFEGNVEHGFTIKDAIEDLMQFQVTQVRGVPWMASSRCLVKLNDFRLFKIQCIDSNLAFETKFSRNDLDDRSDQCHTTFEVKFGRNSLNNDLHNNSVVILKTMDEQDCLDETPTTSCNYPVVDSSSGSYVNSTKDFDRLESKIGQQSKPGGDNDPEAD